MLEARVYPLINPSLKSKGHPFAEHTRIFPYIKCLKRTQGITVGNPVPIITIFPAKGGPHILHVLSSHRMSSAPLSFLFPSFLLYLPGLASRSLDFSPSRHSWPTSSSCSLGDPGSTRRILMMSSSVVLHNVKELNIALNTLDTFS